MRWFIDLFLSIGESVRLCYDSEKEWSDDWNQLKARLDLGLPFHYKGKVMSPDMTDDDMEEAEWCFNHDHIVACKRKVVE